MLYITSLQMATADRETHLLLVTLQHPLRRRILWEMDGGEPTSPQDLAGSLDKSLGGVGYHVKVLADCGALKLVRTKQVHGSTQHFYRLSAKGDRAQSMLGGAEGTSSDSDS